MLCSKLALTMLRLTLKDIPEFFNIGNFLRWLDDLGHDHAPKKNWEADDLSASHFLFSVIKII